MDRANGAGFETIAHMLLEQKKLMDALETENRELRRQLADLRRGVGISLVIEGKTVPIAADAGQGVPPTVPQLPVAVAPPAVPPVKQLNGTENARNTQTRDSRSSTSLADSFVL